MMYLTEQAKLYCSTALPVIGHYLTKNVVTRKLLNEFTLNFTLGRFPKICWRVPVSAIIIIIIIIIIIMIIKTLQEDTRPFGL
jgi:hypothetical protein